MKVWKTTMFKTVRWASSLTPSMPWPTVCTTCTRNCARATLGCVTQWSPSTAATYWTFCSGRPSLASPERTYGSTRMETHLEGKTNFICPFSLTFQKVFKNSVLIGHCFCSLFFLNKYSQFCLVHWTFTADICFLTFVGEECKLDLKVKFGVQLLPINSK